jgi:hypothetical protein
LSVSTPEQPRDWPPPAPPEALACPRCKAPASFAPSIQVCGACQGRFALYAGPLVDTALAVPAPDPQAKRVKVRSAGMLLYHAGILEPESVQEGTLDPVIGRLPVNSTAIAYRHVYSVAFWRTIDKAAVVANAVAWITTGVFAVGAFAQPALLIFAVPWGLLTAWWTSRTYVVRRWHARVIGLKGTQVAVRFDKPWWNRRRFHDELLRRCGLPPAAMP